MTTDYAIPFEEGEEEEVIPKGQHELRIVAAEPKTSEGDPEKGKPSRAMIQVAAEAVDREDCAPVFHYLVFPTEAELADRDSDDNRRKVKMMIRNLRRFLHAFGVGEKEFNDAGPSRHQLLLGKVGRVTITHEMYNGEPQARLNPPKL